jgi:hypothetical protein
MAFSKCFLPMYPLGHKVSEMSSTGMTRGLLFIALELLVVEKVWKSVLVVATALLVVDLLRRCLLADWNMDGSCVV